VYIHLYIYMCLKKAHIHISILVIYDDSDVMGYDRRRAELAILCTSPHETRHKQYREISP